MQINNNNNNIKQENKKLKLEDKNKQNSGISKPALYMGFSMASVALISIIGQILYDKLNKNDNNNPDQQQNNQFKNNDNFTPNKQIFENNDNFTPNKQIDEFKGWYDHGIVTDEYVMDYSKNPPEKVVKGKVTLSPEYQRWICENIALPQQDFPLCWHNVSWLFLLLPEIRFGEEEYRKEFHEGYPEKIKNMINIGNGWIDSYRKMKIKINDYFDNYSQKVKINVDRKTREMPDGLENEITKPDLKGRPFLFYTSVFPGNSYKQEFNGIRFTERIVNLGLNRNLGCDLQYDLKDASHLLGIGIQYRHIDYLINLVANKNKGFTIAYTHPNLILNLDATLSYPANFGFRPTYITVNSDGHYYTFFMLYDSQGNITNYILHDGGKLQIFGANGGYEVLKSKIGWQGFGRQTHTGFFVRYSPLNIIRKYYTPELMFNN